MPAWLCDTTTPEPATRCSAWSARSFSARDLGRWPGLRSRQDMRNVASPAWSGELEKLVVVGTGEDALRPGLLVDDLEEVLVGARIELVPALRLVDPGELMRPEEHARRVLRRRVLDGA